MVCSCRGLAFNSEHPHGKSPAIIPGPGNLPPSSGHQVCVWCVYIHGFLGKENHSYGLWLPSSLLPLLCKNNETLCHFLLVVSIPQRLITDASPSLASPLPCSSITPNSSSKFPSMVCGLVALPSPQSFLSFSPSPAPLSLSV